MPGIVGLITKMPRERAEKELRRMIQSVMHESFYGTGTWVDESQGVYLGWTVRHSSFADGMPLSNERGDVVLVFSGEEFPEPGTARRLKECGHALEEKKSSYLVHLYEEDASFPAGLNGRFDGPRSRNSDPLQRPVRDAPDLLSRVEGEFLFRCRGQGDPRGSSRTPVG